ncbi:hypothetical protein MTO96_025086 [Rhipicephalus appendiculatus]
MLTIRQFSPVLIAIVILVGKGGSVNRGHAEGRLQYFVETPASGKVNLAVVSFDKYWHEADNLLTRRLPWPRTTWIFKKGGFYRYLLNKSAADTTTVAIVASLHIDWREISESVRKTLDNAFIRWITPRDNLTFSHNGEPASVLPACLAVLLDKKRVSHDRPNYNSHGRPLLYDYRPHEESGVKSSSKNTLSGKVMNIACLRSKQFPDRDICSLYSYLFGLLDVMNVSLEYQIHSHWAPLMDEFYCENTDIAVLMMVLINSMMASATYTEMILVPETFYATESEIQAPSLYDTTLRSAWAFAVTAASLIICVGVLLLIGGPQVQERVQTETLFLLALFLARSTPFPNATRLPRVQNIIYLSWALAMLPLCQYFQGELTSMVTVGRPANNLDTLEELEAALDAGLTAPCVPRESASWDGIVNREHPTTLGKKLRATLLKHKNRLVTFDLSSCFYCAASTGGVCYAHRMPSSLLKGFPDRYFAFKEDFVTRAVSMPLRKSFPLRDAYRAFLQRVREAGLFSSPYCKREVVCKRYSSTERTPQIEKPLFELHGFFVFYVMLLAGTVGVLVAELLFARFSEKAFGPRFLRRRRRQR